MNLGRAITAAAIAWTAVACGARPPADIHPGPSRGVAALTPLEQELIVAAVHAIAATWPDSTALCLEILGGPGGPELPSPALLGALRTRQGVASAAACPRTYASMIARVDSLGRRVDPRPLGYVDPYALTVGRPQFTSTSHGWIHALEQQGTSGRAYLCTVQRVQGRATARCQTVRYWVH
jgi:hypothetical protein